MRLVFCGHCKYFKVTMSDLYQGEQCTHPDNYKDSYYFPRAKQIYRPEDKNRNNNCKWYEKKE